MRKILIFVLIGVVIGVICFIAGGKVKEKQYEDTMLYYYKELNRFDSIEMSMAFRSNKQLSYYGMKREEVLAVLPPPQYNENKIVYDDGNIPSWHSLYRPYEDRVIGTQDTIIVNTCAWEIPYHDRPSLLIVFEKRGEEWIATKCLQWNPKLVDID